MQLIVAIFKVPLLVSSLYVIMAMFYLSFTVVAKCNLIHIYYAALYFEIGNCFLTVPPVDTS